MSKSGTEAQAAGVAPHSSLAIISLISGILGLTLFPLLGSIAAVLTGLIARREIRDSGGALQGEGLALAGLVLGWVGIGTSAIGVCLVGTLALFPLCLALLLATGEASGLVPAMALLL